MNTQVRPTPDSESDVSGIKFASETNRKYQSASMDAPPERVDKVKAQLQDVIEMMGPSTPKLRGFSNSNDADNEESVFSTTSIISSVVQLKLPQESQVKADNKKPEPEMYKVRSIEIAGQNYNNNIPRDLCHQCHQVVPVSCRTNGVRCIECRSILHETVAIRKTGRRLPNKVDKNRKRLFDNWFSNKVSKYNCKRKPSDLYKIEVEQTVDNGPLPKRFIFDLVENPQQSGTVANREPDKNENMDNQTWNRRNTYINFSTLPQEHEKHSAMRSSKSMKEKIKCYCANPKKSKPKMLERVDVYYFDHGNSSFFRTTDKSPIGHTELFAEKAVATATKFWAEIFGTFYVAFAFATSFILQLVRFILYSIIRPFTVGLIQLFSDYFLKPFLTICFNGIIQPPLILLFNISTSIRDLCKPIAQGVGYFIREISVMCRSIRFVEVTNNKNDTNNKDNNNVGNNGSPC